MEFQPVPPRWTRLRWAYLAAAIVAVVAALALAGLWYLFDSDASPADSVALVGDSVAVIDPRSGVVVGEIAVGGRPSGLAIGDGAVWVGNRDQQTLLRIDPESKEVAQTIELPSEPSEIAVGAGSVWVLSEPARAVLRVDPGSENVVASVPYRDGTFHCCRPQILVAGGAVWVSAYGVLSRIDTANNVVSSRGAYLGWIASFGDAVWLVNGPELDQVEKVDARTNAIVGRIRLEPVGNVRGVSGLAAADGVLWATTTLGDVLWKVDPRTGRVGVSIALGMRADGMAIGEDALWIAGRNRLFRIDARAGALAKTIALDVVTAYVQGRVAAGAGGVWVATSAP